MAGRAGNGNYIFVITAKSAPPQSVLNYKISGDVEIKC
jgi:hypothetical protein